LGSPVSCCVSIVGCSLSHPEECKNQAKNHLFRLIKALLGPFIGQLGSKTATINSREAGKGALGVAPPVVIKDRHPAPAVKSARTKNAKAESTFKGEEEDAILQPLNYDCAGVDNHYLPDERQKPRSHDELLMPAFEDQSPENVGNQLAVSPVHAASIKEGF